VHGHRTNIIEYEARPLARLASEAQSEELLSVLKKNGINIMTNTQIVGIQKNALGVYQIALKDNVSTLSSIKLEADIVIAAVGLEADKRLANHSGLAFADGFSVDPKSMQTSVPNIYALGDCASINGQVQRYIEPISRQAQTIVHDILKLEARPFIFNSAPIRLKSRSSPMTFR
jgi:rubredoxin---NAD+ reductase